MSLLCREHRETERLELHKIYHVLICSITIDLGHSRVTTELKLYKCCTGEDMIGLANILGHMTRIYLAGPPVGKMLYWHRPPTVAMLYPPCPDTVIVLYAAVLMLYQCCNHATTTYM